jgi:hypothetical protein
MKGKLREAKFLLRAGHVADKPGGDQIGTIAAKAVSWIRGILIRIRILGSVRYIANPDPIFFLQWLQDSNNKKISFF